MRATRAIIHLNNLRNNFRVIKDELQPGVKICLAVKADAYGHGAVEVARVAVSENVESLGVATLPEAVEIIEAGINLPVIMFSLPFPGEIHEIISRGIHTFVGGRTLIETIAREAENLGKKSVLHLKVDTGMGRIGCSPREAVELAGLIEKNPFLELGGVCTHFAGADLKDQDFSIIQLNCFNRVLDEIRSRGINPGLIHAANSGAVIGLPGSQFNMVRPGIMAYGYYPSLEQERVLPIKPVMELRSKISFVKNVEQGTPISYGMTYRPAVDTCIATLPLGYGDGYSRLLSNNSDVLIKGKRYPIAGRVCMDQCMVDLGKDSPVRLYDDVTLFGPYPAGPDAEEIAEKMGTIPYEVTCLIGKRVPRVYTD